ncbi:MAG: asparagine synthase (glutamine-hydrolyzing) [bacterium]|nr:asparagine synthase (glutamine-hydrolyzing) [bacterium]
MCGICGFVDRAGRIGEPVGVLRRMNDTMVHRGPDDAGWWVQGRTGLAMRRLSIIDLESGHQPMSNEDGTVWVVFNGEIYNFKEVREELRGRGHEFRTRSDTEVIVHGYEEFGEEVWKRLDGMFAVALYDVGKDRLMLGRDRTGKKPLYYYDGGEAFVFGSELKAVLAFPGMRREIDKIALQQYLLCHYVITPRSIFKGIKKVPAGHYMVVERGEAKGPWAYWRYRFADPPEERSEEEWLEMVDEALYKAVERRLEADVPLGVFLSGGVDSSLVVAEMCRARGAEGVHTFSVGLDDPAYDESRWSRWAARVMGTRHCELQLRVDGMLEVLDVVMGNMDEPMGDSSIIPTYVICKATREHVKVALAGDAGDEVFGGYPKYFAQRWAKGLERVPRWVRRWAMEKPLSLLPSPDGSVLLGQGKVGAFFRYIDMHYALRNQLWVSPFTPGVVSELLGVRLEDEALAPIFGYAAGYEGPDDIVTRSMYMDFCTILHDDFNVKVDRASMLSSLEVREPFLDTGLIELAARMPSDLKVRGMQTKYLLKKLCTRYYPKEFVYRKKWGFGIPVKRWIRGALRRRFEETLGEGAVRAAGLVDAGIVKRLLREHVSGAGDHAGALWNLFVLHEWHGRWGGRQGV